MLAFTRYLRCFSRILKVFRSENGEEASASGFGSQIDATFLCLDVGKSMSSFWRNGVAKWDIGFEQAELRSLDINVGCRTASTQRFPDIPT